MSLTMRPAGIGFGFYKDADGYSVFSGEWCIGRIYENSSVPEDQRLVLDVARTRRTSKPAPIKSRGVA
jgi:hypothetical protein